MSSQRCPQWRARQAHCAWLRRAATLLLAAWITTGCSEASRTSVFETALSPHGDYTLTAYVIEPWFPHGPHHIALELHDQKADTREQLLKTELAYDGVPFTKRNIGLRWTGERSAFMCLSATDRPDKGVQITLPRTGASRVVLRKGC